MDQNVLKKSVDHDEKMVIEEVARALREIRFGSIELIIHDARVVQIERKEKLRFQRPNA